MKKQVLSTFCVSNNTLGGKMTDMRTRLAFILSIMLSAMVLHGEEIRFPAVRIDCQNLLPPKWVVTDVDTDTTPYGIEKKKEESCGLGLTFSGDRKVRGWKGEPEFEAFTVYVMPKGFTGAKPTIPGPQHSPAKLLGLTGEGCPVYVMPWSEIESWRGWEKAIHDSLVKKEPNKHLQPTPR